MKSLSIMSALIFFPERVLSLHRQVCLFPFLFWKVGIIELNFTLFSNRTMAASRLLLQSVFHCRLQPSTAFTSFSTLPCRAIHSRTASIGYQHSLSSPVYHARGPKISLSTLYPSPTRVPLQKNHTFLSSQRSYHSSEKHSWYTGRGWLCDHVMLYWLWVVQEISIGRFHEEANHFLDHVTEQFEDLGDELSDEVGCSRLLSAIITP